MSTETTIRPVNTEDSGSSPPPVDLGRCCACHKVGSSVRNVLHLNRRAPVAGTGWGCGLCGLPRDGALAVLCDQCMASDAGVLDVVNGPLTGKLRMPYRECVGTFIHWNAHVPLLGSRLIAEC